jgi:hypothetical protein
MNIRVEFTQEESEQDLDNAGGDWSKRRCHLTGVLLQ